MIVAGIMVALLALAALAAGAIARELRRPRLPPSLLCPACSNREDFDRGRARVRCLRCGYVVSSSSGRTGPDPTWLPGDRR